MSMQETGGSSRKDTITLSDLFRLKKCERPPDEFWETFERQLKSRQLQALVKPTWKKRFAASATVAGAWLAPAAVASLALLLVWDASRDPRVLSQPEVEARDARFADVLAAQEMEGVAAIEEPRHEPALDLALSDSIPAREEPQADPRPSFVFDAIMPNSGRQTNEPFRTEAKPDTLRIGAPPAEYALNTYEYGYSPRFETTPMQRRFRVYSDLYETTTTRQLEGGVTVEF